ncbi:hypothetical protein [Candidatus Protochlamydia phocaeensis]|uniref:hypothetical protein n=1 Tax=Candidatus Protochlamydia phocaeensis TaxID=1414722 RepID=UPI000839358E|nr:hypothetical protein [Candidatus Protochlamydia phocaeensis]
MDKNDTDKQKDLLEQLKSYSIRIGENLFKRISKHIKLLKTIGSPISSKQSWMEQAISEKLEREKNSLSNEMLSDTYLHFKIDLETHAEIEKRVEVIKKFRSSFSKKQWFLEAIFDKLDKDEEQAKHLLQDMVKASICADSESNSSKL